MWPNKCKDPFEDAHIAPLEWEDREILSSSHVLIPILWTHRGQNIVEITIISMSKKLSLKI